jgi:hypothetical protein
VSFHDIAELIEALDIGSKDSLWSLSHVGHVGSNGSVFETNSLILDIFKGTLEDSRLLSSENIKDEEGKEHEEVSIEHSFGNS